MANSVESAGNYPVRHNKRENKVIETAMSGAALAADADRVAFVEATAADDTTDFGDLAVGELVVHIPAVAGNSQAGLCAVAGTAPFAAVIGDFYLIVKPK